ncbi:BUD13 homolog isoform X8 [Dreissena polymorpha]|uniref:BUD13 homolog isoform X8 n=1 Tax=Dreissena polymorpha TaxID=45954 RepID=UPI002264B876|nr:BUD13 homolog isoform X8 [Dreissena polymorpha]
MAAPIKADYLKKYLSENAEQKKKKKRPKVPGIPAKIIKSRIVDDDVDFKSLLPENLSNTLDDDVGDNDPTVADVIDERPESVQILEKYRKSGTWKVMGDGEPIFFYSMKVGPNGGLSTKESENNSDSERNSYRRRRYDSESDQSPPGKKRHDSDSDQSPPRKKRHDSDSDQSPPRKKRLDSDSDTSPHKKKIEQARSSSNTKSKDSSEKTLSGKRAGLSSASEMRREAEDLKRREDEKFRLIDNDRLGKGAATVFRDKKSGKIRDLADERKQKSEADKIKAQEEEKFRQWGKGLKQIEKQSEKLNEALHEADKPLARYRDDEDLDQMLKDMDRAEDPMLAFIKKKKSKSTGPTKAEKTRYKGPAPPPNRFGILPGYRWDGVNRSNGFEKQVYAKQAETRATADAAYKWSVEDM